MAKIARKTQLQFGSTAAGNQIGQFGSLAAGSAAYTTDPAVIQSLSNYLTGWFGAILGNNSPAIEDMNALCYLYAYQLAYLFQAGVAEYDSSTPYYQGSLCQSGGVLYQSVNASVNTGNALTNGVYWGPLVQNPVVSNNTLPITSGTVTVASGQTLFQPYFKIQSGATVSVSSGGALLSITTLTVLGTLTVATGGTARVIP